MEPEKILLVEDEDDISHPIKVGLESEGYLVAVAKDGQTAFRKLVDRWDLLILDLNLPDMSGESILSNLKQQPDYPTILVLTARGSIQDKLSLFRQGCDDYLTKPFIFDELLERVRALLRRSQRVNSSELKYEDLTLDPTTHLLQTTQSQVASTPKETSVLRFFFARPNQVISRRELLHHVWGLKEEPDTNFIGVHLFNLRKKLSQIEKAEWLQTVRNSGFVFSKNSVSEHVS